MKTIQTAVLLALASRAEGAPVSSYGYPQRPRCVGYACPTQFGVSGGYLERGGAASMPERSGTPPLPPELKTFRLPNDSNRHFQSGEILLVEQGDGSMVPYMSDGRGGWSRSGRQATVYGPDGRERKLLAMEKLDDLGRVIDHIMYDMTTGQRIGSWEKEVADRYERQGDRFVEKPEPLTPAPRLLNPTAEDVKKALRGSDSALDLLARAAGERDVWKGLNEDEKLKLLEKLEGSLSEPHYEAIAGLISSKEREFSAKALEILSVGQPEDGKDLLAKILASSAFDSETKAMAAELSPWDRVKHGNALNQLLEWAKGDDGPTSLAAIRAIAKHPQIYHLPGAVDTLIELGGRTSAANGAVAVALREWMERDDEIKAAGDEITRTGNWGASFESEERTKKIKGFLRQ